MNNNPTQANSPGLIFNDMPIRSVLDKGVPWLSAVDICRALKLKRYDTPSRWLRKIPAHQRGQHPIMTSGGKRTMVTISPFGALALAKQRKRPADAQMRKWLREEVLPLIPEGAEAQPPAAITSEPAAAPTAISQTLRHIADLLEKSVVVPMTNNDLDYVTADTEDAHDGRQPA